VPRNRILVLDYDSVAGLRIAPLSPIIVGADDANDQSDLLGGLALDEAHGTLFVSNSSDGLVRAYDVTTGAEKTGSPLTVGAQPSKMGVDPSTNLLLVSSLGGTVISVIHTDDLTLPVSSFDVGVTTGSVAAATNAAGTVLFTVSPLENEIRVFLLNIADPATSTPIGSPITAPEVGQPDTPQNLLSGAAAQAAAAPLADGRIAGLITQSTGDLGFIDVSADLSGFVTGRTAVLNGQGAEGIDVFKDGAGNGIRAYFAVPGGSTVSFVDITTNIFIGQIF
jgi:DNA-binding beta-propeller fold protein YncE